MVVKLIIDTDPGIDDILGIFLALGSREKAKLEAITLNFGNTTLDHCHDNILRTFNVLHKHIQEDPTEEKRSQLAKVIVKDAPPILFSEGAAVPLGGRQFTAAYFHGRDGLSGVTNLEGDPFPTPKEIPSPLQETKTPAYQVILDILAKNPPGTVRIAAVGPLTNIALAWEKDPETFLRVGGISVMGGALDVPGNTTPVAEFNIYADPFAARRLLHDAPLHPLLKSKRGKLPVELLPLDITSEHLVPYSRLCDDQNSKPGILCQFRRAIMANPRRVTNSFAPINQPFDPNRDDMFVAHDPLAIAHAIYSPCPFQRGYQSSPNEDFNGWKVQTRRFGIETEGSLTRGFCVVDRREMGNAKRGSNKAAHDEEAKQKDEDLNSISSHFKAAKTQVAAAPTKNQHHQPTDGEWDVVVASPGVDWFAQIFCSALGV